MKSMLATAGVSVSVSALSTPVEQLPDFPKPSSSPANLFPVSIFSKNLHWLDYSTMATVAAELGFDGVDLTVRPEGHVLPENVTTDLPKALQLLKKSGLNIFTITTAITSAEDPFAESILKTASALGITNYRMGWINYDDTLGMEDNLSAIKSRLIKLSALNKKYGMQAHYQNHAGTSFGSPVWDLAGILKEINSPGLASQYDIRHATAEAANAWTLGLKLLTPYIKSINIKDFQWIKKEGKWQIENTPLGEGMVDFKKYFTLLKAYKVTGPISIHYEYDLGGAENGAKVLTIEKEKVLAAMKRDNVKLKDLLKESGLR